MPSAASIALHLVLVLMALVAGGRVCGQVTDQADLADRPISGIRVQGLSRVSEQKVLNNIRSAVGDPFDPDTVRGDVSLLSRLGEFKFVDADAQLRTDGTVLLIFRVEEQALISERQVVGNKVVSDQDLLDVVRLVPRGPRDDFLIEQAKRAIIEKYRDRGHYLATVTIDEGELEETGVLLFRITEGPRVRVKAIEFEGVRAFPVKQVRSRIDTQTAFPLFRRGELDKEVIARDVAEVDRFYKDRGYLDVRVGHRVDISPDSREAKVVYLVAEGRRYTLRSLRTERQADGAPLAVFSNQQVGALLLIQPGDTFSADKLRKSLNVLRQAYELQGYLDVRVSAQSLRVGEAPEVDLLLIIDEGRQYDVGDVSITGNFLTRDRVVRRELRGLQPGRPFDGTQIEEARRRLEQTRLFNQVDITVQPPEDETSTHRDVVVEVKERNTGSVNFGVAIGSDSGVFGELSINQNNFDITDHPESFRELITGRAYRGAGQRFSSVLRPGDEIFQYSLSWAEPHLFDTDYSFSSVGSFRQREFRRYDEERITGNFRFGRKLGDIWEFSVGPRVERVELDDIAPFAPIEVFRDRGPDTLLGIGLTLSRTTIKSFVRPDRGSRFELSFENFGSLGGDVDFNLVSSEYTVFFTLDEDFLGRKSILKLNGRVGYIFDGRAPTYERFYLGGRSLRGFEFREVSPKGIRADTGGPSDDPIGGNWLVFLGAQYEVPLFEEVITGVVFMDSGTVLLDVGLDDYRVAVGVGLRLYIPQLGPVPIALDFATPLQKESGDDTQVFSFTAELPF